VDQTQIDALLRQGIAAAKAGQTEQARQDLLRVVELDETNVQAWLWLSSVVDDPAEKFTCLHNVLTLDPDNQPAKLGLARLDQFPDAQPADISSPPPAPSDESEVSYETGTTPSQPPRRVSRYKRLTPRSTSDKSNAAPLIEGLESDSVAEPDASRSQKAINSNKSVEERYKRSSTDDSDSIVPSQKPRHLEEYPSMASALIQKKSGSIGGGADEVSERSGAAQCPFCRSPIAVMAVECDHCRLPLVVDCPVCDARIDVESSACPSCGRSMGTFKDKTVYFANLAASY
jgi:hypothetical protein